MECNFLFSVSESKQKIFFYIIKPTTTFSSITKRIFALQTILFEK